MAPIHALQRARSPSSGRRRQLVLPALLQLAQETRARQDTNNINPTNMSPLTSLSDLSDALSISDNHNTHAPKRKGVRFSDNVSVVEIPAPEQPNAARVSFSDEVIDIDTVEPIHSSPSPSPPKKRVRFGCLKTGVRKHLSHKPIYKMTNFDAIKPFIDPKKRVRFGCIKCETPPHSRSHDHVTELLADEAATFIRERKKASELTEEADESDAPKQTPRPEKIELD